MSESSGSEKSEETKGALESAIVPLTQAEWREAMLQAVEGMVGGPEFH